MATTRLLELILTEDGGAELWDVNSEVSLWASDSDDEFREEFSEMLDESDVEHVQDYLVAHEIMTEDEADCMEISAESPEPVPVNGDDDEEDEEDEDEED